jgi:F-type H+-transporting ATPase subunit b
MTSHFLNFAASEKAASGDIFSSLGINGQMLLMQTIGFLILVFILNKWVFPVFIKIVDERQDSILAGVKAAEQAEKKAAEAEERLQKLLKDARAEAKDIVVTAKDEASAMIAASEQKAKARAEKIVRDAHEQLEKDVIAARKALHNETLDLVAMATEKVVGRSVNKDINKTIIAEAVKDQT